MATSDKAVILIVVDDPKDRLAIRMLLEGTDRQLILARDGVDARQFAHEHEPALILLDVSMPNTCGFRTALSLRRIEHTRHTPIVFLTAPDDEPIANLRSGEIGAADHVAMHRIPELLRSKVSVYIDLYRKSAELRREIADHRVAEQQLRDSEGRLRALAGHLISMREQERTHIAREIHDELGQVLTALKMDIAWLANQLDDIDMLAKTESMCQLVDDAIRTVRKISGGLRPEVLDNMGLVPAIAWQTVELQKRTGLRCRTTLPPDTTEFDKALSNTLFRIFQEILTNIARHAHATRVDIQLRQAVDAVILEVADNGIGIAQHQASGKASLGLLGMRERALSLGGTVEISGATGTGTRVVVSIPDPRMHRRRDAERHPAHVERLS